MDEQDLRTILAEVQRLYDEERAYLLEAGFTEAQALSLIRLRDLYLFGEISS